MAETTTLPHHARALLDALNAPPTPESAAFWGQIYAATAGRPGAMEAFRAVLQAIVEKTQ